MNAMRSFVVVALCLSAAGLFGETYNVSDVASLMEALGKAGDDDVIDVVAGHYRLTGTIAVGKRITLVGAGADETFFEGDNLGDNRALTIGAAGAVVKGVRICNVQSRAAQGGAVLITAGTLADSTIANVKSLYSGGQLKGGGVAVNGASAILSNCTVCAISTVQGDWRYGLAGHIQNGLIVDCLFCDNESTVQHNQGVGLHVAAGTVRRCRFVNNGMTNSHNAQGSALYQANGVVEGCTFTENYGWNGAAYVNAGTFRNCLVYGNTGKGATAGGIRLQGGTVEHCTVVGNVSDGDAVGANGLVQNGGTSRYCIFSGNGPASGAGSCSATAGTFSYNLVDRPAAIGSGNFVADPRFADAANGDYRLTVASPAIDAAVGSTVKADLLGVTRPDGAAADVGCYEYVHGQGALSCGVKISQRDWPQGTAVKFVAVVDGVDTTGAVYTWYLDGSETPYATGADRATITVENLAAGTHSVRLTVTVGGTTVEDSVADAARVLPSKTYVNLTGSNTPPYATPETAARNVQDAIDAVWKASAPAGIVEIAEGTYPVSSTLSLTTAVELRGAGRDKTILDRSAGTGQGVYMTSALAAIRDLTLAGVTNNAIRGAGVQMTAGTLSGVKLLAPRCSNTGDGIYGCGIYMTDGLVTNCIVSGATSAASGWNYGTGVCMTGGTLTHTEISDSHAVNHSCGTGVQISGGTMRYCQVLRNSADKNDSSHSTGGGIDLKGAATVENCTVAGNQAFIGAGVYVHHSWATLRNTVVCDNRSTGDLCAGVQVTKDSGTVQNCTIAGNVASGDTLGRSGLQMEGGIVENCIVYGNGTLGSVNRTGGTFRKCVTDKEVIGGTDVTVGDPLFVDAANGDYRLKFGSPAIDQATTLSGVKVDRDGVSRPQLDGPDIGAYEFFVPAGEFICGLLSSVSSCPFGTVPQFTATVLGGTPPYTYTWTFDGVLYASGEGDDYKSVGWTGIPNGVHDVALLVRDSEGVEKQVEAKGVVTVKPSKVYVDAKGGNVAPYDTPAKAAHVPEDAFAAVWRSPGVASEVEVAEGTYPVYGQFGLDGDVDFHGAGVGKTVLCGAEIDPAQRVFSISSPQATVRDLTISGVTNRAVQGSVVWMSTGVVTRVALEKNKSSGTYTQAPIYLTGGTVRDVSIVATVFTGSDWKYGGGIYMTGGLVDGATVVSNRFDVNAGGGGVYMTGGALRNSRIVGNRAPRKNGGGVHMTSGTVENCLIVGNEGGADGGMSNDHGTGIYAEGGKVINCTISGNVPFKDGLVSAAASFGSGVTVVNTIVYGNASQDVTGGAVPRHCCWPGAADGVNGNLSADPLFRRPSAGDYRLKAASPCVDKGDNALWLTRPDALDLGGQPRIRDNIVDMGCYECTRWGMLLLVK